MFNKSFSKSFLSIFGGKVGETLLFVFITPILVRVLGSGGYGNYAFFLSIFGLTTIICDFGLFDGSRKFIAEKPDDSCYVSEIALASYGIGFTTFIICSFLVFLIMKTKLMQDLIGINYLSYTAIFIFALAGGQLFRVSRSILLGLGMENKSEPLLPLQYLFFGLIGIPLANYRYGVEGIIFGFSLAILLVGLISFKVVFSTIVTSFNLLYFGIKKHGMKLSNFGMYSLIIVFLFQSLYQTDLIMIKYFLTDVDVGYYKAALQTSEFLWFIPWSLQIALLHSSSNMWANQSFSKIDNLVSKLVKYTFIIVVLMAAGLFILAEPFLKIYFGSEFIVAYFPLLILLFGVVGFSIARIVVPIIQGKGDLRLLTIIMMLVAGMNLSLNYLLIPIYGISGAAVATSISYGSMFIMTAYAAKKIGFSPFKKVPWLNILFGGIAVVFVLYPISLLIMGSALKLIIIPPMGLILYLLIMIRLDVLTIEEITILFSKLPKPIYERFIFALYNSINQVKKVYEKLRY